MRDGRWVTESSRDSKSEAMELAEKFLGKKECAGARIIANKENRDGSTTETVVFEKTQAANTTKKIQTPPSRRRRSIASTHATSSAWKAAC